MKEKVQVDRRLLLDAILEALERHSIARGGRIGGKRLSTLVEQAMQSRLQKTSDGTWVVVLPDLGEMAITLQFGDISVNLEPEAGFLYPIVFTDDVPLGRVS